MNVTVSSRTDSLDEATREKIRGRIYFALSRFSSRIEQVAVQLRDVGETTGSPQHLCRLSVRMTRLGSFAVESVMEERFDAVSRAADRAAKRVQRFLDRRHDET